MTFRLVVVDPNSGFGTTTGLWPCAQAYIRWIPNWRGSSTYARCPIYRSPHLKLSRFSCVKFTIQSIYLMNRRGDLAESNSHFKGLQSLSLDPNATAADLPQNLAVLRTPVGNVCPENILLRETRSYASSKSMKQAKTYRCTPKTPRESFKHFK